MWRGAAVLPEGWRGRVVTWSNQSTGRATFVLLTEAMIRQHHGRRPAKTLKPCSTPLANPFAATTEGA